MIVLVIIVWAIFTLFICRAMIRQTNNIDKILVDRKSMWYSE